ncbi:hypothetical protein D3C75_1383870 [compost metagenome]
MALVELVISNKNTVKMGRFEGTPLTDGSADVFYRNTIFTVWVLRLHMDYLR